MKAVLERNRHYYKYVYSQKTSPSFSSETEAINGVDGVKMLTTTSYYTITGSSTVILYNSNILTFDLGENVKDIASLGYVGVCVGGQYPGTVLLTIQCSEDNSTWTTISSRFGGRGDYRTNPLTITTPNNYRYVRFTTYCDDTEFGSIGGAYGLQIKYSKGVKTETTEEEAEFYEDTYICKLYVDTTTNTYKAIKE